MTKEGISGSIGFVNGTSIPVYQRPRTDSETNWNRRHRRSMSAQIVCDCDKCIILMTTTYLGSMIGTYVFSNVNIATNPYRHYSLGECLLAGMIFCQLCFLSDSIINVLKLTFLTDSA